MGREHPDRVARDRPLLERLTPLDVSNLRVERHGLPVNVAALASLESRALLDASGELLLGAIRSRIEQRLHLAPRLRQRLGGLADDLERLGARSLDQAIAA